jgi:hypothetical protein
MNSEIEKAQGNVFKINAEITQTSMTFSANVTVDELKNVGRQFVKMEDSKQWWIGDWWNALERKYGEAQQICEDVNLSCQTAKNSGWVARSIEKSRRRDNLTWSHHAEVCGIKLDDKEKQKRIQDKFLDKAEQEGWSIRELRGQVQAFLDEEKWSEEEKNRRQLVLDGNTILINLKTDDNLRTWAEMNDLLIRIDRGSEWGNPFVLGKDGNRDTVCNNYSVYLGMKPSLLRKLPELKGKVLGCWCYPERCHGDELIGRL